MPGYQIGVSARAGQSDGGAPVILAAAETVDIAVAPAGAMRMHVFRPAADVRFPAILLFSEIYQVTQPIRRLSAILAGHGYIVGVPEVYHEYEPAGTVLGYDAAGTARGNELKYRKTLSAYEADAAAAISALARHPVCSGRIATFGICLGGHLAYRAALDPRVTAAACFYPTDIHSGSLGLGQSDDSLSRMADLKAQIMFVWGRHDPHIPASGRAIIRDRLESVNANFEWHEVNAQHAFLRDEGPRFDPDLYLRCIISTLAFLENAFRCETRSA
ncbi:carboxymethylenebutenolidase [Sphingomonas zeicaulis]|uniref:dienelactone hydrolase family protein n=1 Tax=Sphingomonas zeicaulis TaxID=1632740 RepID=UPI003D2241C3